MTYELVCKETIGKMVAMRKNSPDVQTYLALEKELKNDKKIDSDVLSALATSGAIEPVKFVQGPAMVYFRPKDVLVANDKGLPNITNTQVQAIANLCPDLIKSVLTAAIIDEAIQMASGKRSDDALAIQKINRQKLVSTVYTPVIGEAKN